MASSLQPGLTYCVLSTQLYFYKIPSHYPEDYGRGWAQTSETIWEQHALGLKKRLKHKTDNFQINKARLCLQERQLDN